MTIHILAGSILVATGMSYGSYAQNGPAAAPKALMPAVAGVSAPDPYIEKRMQAKLARQQDEARQHRREQQILAESIAAHAQREQQKKAAP